MRALHHGMSGVPGRELFGPWEDAEDVRAAIVEAGEEFGLKQVGSRVYATNTLESGWIPCPLPAVFTGDEMKAYREWLPANGYEATGSLGGSFYSDDISDYYLTPHDLGYWGFVKFDHDFIGREALEAMGEEGPRRKVTLAWNGEDVAAAMRTLFEKGDPAKYIDLPLSNYSTWPNDKLLLDGEQVGVSTFSGYSYNERSMLSLGVVNSDVEVGTEVVLVWGEENGGSAKPVVERHRQVEIRATSARSRTRRSPGRPTPRAPGGRRRRSSQAGAGARASAPRARHNRHAGMPATPLIGREDELDRVETFLAAVERGPAILVLSGEAGIGKTALWETGLAEAERRFGHVLVCRGVEAEASFAFAGLSELVAPFFDEVASTLLEPRRRALEIALLRVAPDGEAPDPHGIGLAVLDVLVALAETRPVVVAVDDMQWLDPASAGVLKLALRRLREERVGLLATHRTGPEAAVPFELERAFAEERLDQLAVGPLSLGGIHRLLEERLGLELTRPELARVQEATAGNPFFTLELGRELVRTGARPAPGQALHVPDSLRDLLGGRLARLPGETLDVLLLVSALARPTVDVVATAHGERTRVEQSARLGRRGGRGRVRRPSASASRTRCSPRSVTSRHRRGSAVPLTGRSPTRSRTRRSRPAISRWPPTVPTPRSRRGWTTRPNRPPDGERPRPRPISASWRRS